MQLLNAVQSIIRKTACSVKNYVFLNTHYLITSLSNYLIDLISHISTLINSGMVIGTFERPKEKR